MSSPNFEESDFETDGIEDVALDGNSIDDGLIDDGLIDDGLIEGDASAPESDELGKTSDENPLDSATAADVDPAEDPKRQFSVFDAMLLISLVCISLATVLLLFALRNYGDFPFAFPWNVSDI